MKIAETLDCDAIIERLHLYMTESHDARNAIEMLINDCDSDELTEEQINFVIKEICVPSIAIRFAQHYNGISSVSDPDPGDCFRTYVKFEGLDETVVDAVAKFINESAQQDFEEDDDNIDDSSVVFQGQDDWKTSTPEERQNRVKLFLKKLSSVAHDAKELLPFLKTKTLKIGNQINPWGVKYGVTKTFNRQAHNFGHPNELGSYTGNKPVGKVQTFNRVASRFGHPNELGNWTGPNEETELEEGFPTRKHFQMAANAVRAISDPVKRQELANHHAEIFSQQNPRFDHQRFHAAAGTTWKGENKRNESIVSPNSSGQGYDELHRASPLHKTLQAHNFSYSHSTPITQRNGSTLHYHTWANGEHKVGAYEGDTKWNSKVSSASGHSHSGIGVRSLESHLKNKLKKYPQLRNNNESSSLPNTKLSEGLVNSSPEALEKIRQYARWMQSNPMTQFGHQIEETSQAKDLIEAEKLKAKSDKIFGSNDPANFKDSLFDQRSGKRK